MSSLSYDHIGLVQANIPLETLIERVDKNVIELDKSRKWSIIKSSDFLESLLLGLPFGLIYIDATGRTPYRLIDGNARLLSVWEFMKNKFPMTQTEEGYFDDQYFSDLHGTFSNRLEGAKVQVYSTAKNVPLDALASIYRRYGGD